MKLEVLMGNKISEKFVLTNDGSLESSPEPLAISIASKYSDNLMVE
jgi:hypothetical protein